VLMFSVVCYNLSILLRSSHYLEHGGSRFIRTIVTSVTNYRGFLINLFIWQGQVCCDGYELTELDLEDGRKE
jgi:hypothetical protein